MKIQVENVSPVERKVTIEVDPDRVAKELERAYVGPGAAREAARVPPRQGAAQGARAQLPRRDRGRGAREARPADASPRRSKVESIPLVAPPHVSVAEGVADGKPVRYTARVEVKPSIEPKDYRGLDVTRKPPEVTDQMVSDELSRLQESIVAARPGRGPVRGAGGRLGRHRPRGDDRRHAVRGRQGRGRHREGRAGLDLGGKPGGPEGQAGSTRRSRSTSRSRPDHRDRGAARQGRPHEGDAQGAQDPAAPGARRRASRRRSGSRGSRRSTRCARGSAPTSRSARSAAPRPR